MRSWADRQPPHQSQVHLNVYKGKDNKESKYKWFANQVVLLDEKEQDAFSSSSRGGEERRRQSDESERGERREGRGEADLCGGATGVLGEPDTARKRNHPDSGWSKREKCLENSSSGGAGGGWTPADEVGGGSGSHSLDPRLRPPTMSRDNSFVSQDRDSPVPPPGGWGGDQRPRDPRLLAAAANSADDGGGIGTPDHWSPLSSDQQSEWALTWAELSSAVMIPIQAPDYAVFPEAWSGILAYKQGMYNVSARHIMGDVEEVMEALDSLHQQGGRLEVKARVRHEEVESKFTRQMSAREGAFFSISISWLGLDHVRPSLLPALLLSHPPPRAASRP